MFDIISNILLIVGFFGLFDLLAEDRDKQKISLFVFGFHDITFRDFENVATTAIINMYMKNGSISFLRIAILSYILFLITNVGIYSGFYSSIIGNSENIPDELAGWSGLLNSKINLLLFIFGGIFSIPFDYISIIITKRLFYNKNHTIYKMLLYSLLDLAISITPYILIVVFMIFLYSSYFVYEKNTIFVYLMLIVMAISILSSISTFYVTIIIVSTIIVGVFLRSLTAATKLSSVLVLRTNIHNSPFSFIGLLIGLLFSCYNLLT